MHSTTRKRIQEAYKDAIQLMHAQVGGGGDSARTKSLPYQVKFQEKLIECYRTKISLSSMLA